MEAGTVSQRDPTAGNGARTRDAASLAVQGDREAALGAGRPGTARAFAAFALTTFVLSMFNADLVGRSGEPVVLGVALAYGGIAQVLAGMWEFRTGNTFGAVAFTSFGAFWLSYWALVTFFAGDLPAAHAGAAMGSTCGRGPLHGPTCSWPSLRTTGAIALVFFLLTITFILLGIGNSGADDKHRQGRRLGRARDGQRRRGMRRLRQ